MFPSSGDKAENVRTCIDHIKKTYCGVAGHRNDIQLTIMCFVTHHFTKHLCLECGTAVYNGILS
jgi:hypothetical protein